MSVHLPPRQLRDGPDEAQELGVEVLRCSSDFIVSGEPAVGSSQAATLRKSIMNMTRNILCGLLASVATLTVATAPAFAQKPPSVVILMTDDVGWSDFGYISGGGADLGHPTPNIDRIAKEGAHFTSWYGQASCTAGRASF